MYTPAEAEPRHRNREWIRAKTLAIVDAIPVPEWEEQPQYQEVEGDVQFSVRGFRTTLRIPGSRSFVVWLEELTQVSPDSMKTPFGLFTSPYRIKVSGSRNEPGVDLGSMDKASRSDNRARFLFDKLYKEITKPREQTEQQHQSEVIDDFSDVLATNYGEDDN